MSDHDKELEAFLIKIGQVAPTARFKIVIVVPLLDNEGNLNGINLNADLVIQKYSHLGYSSSFLVDAGFGAAGVTCPIFFRKASFSFSHSDILTPGG